MKTCGVHKVFPDICNKFRLPADSEGGNILYESKKVKVSIIRGCRFRRIGFSFKGHDLIEGDFFLNCEPEESMCIATPFDECRKYFLYSQKIPGMRCKGTLKVNDDNIVFDERNTFSLLNWGRGVFPCRPGWYWGAAQGFVNDKVFAFNLGYGYGNTDHGTENMLFYDGVATKLMDVQLIVPDDHKEPWHVTSPDNRIKMLFRPVYERCLSKNMLVASVKQRRVYGYFSGYGVPDSGKVINAKELFGFLERADYRW